MSLASASQSLHGSSTSSACSSGPVQVSPLQKASQGDQSLVGGQPQLWVVVVVLHMIGCYLLLMVWARRRRSCVGFWEEY